MYGSMSLDGDWLLRWADGQRGGLRFHPLSETDGRKWIPAHVPGEVHWDLVRAGLLAEPTQGMNILGARWIEEAFWTYRRIVVPPQAALSGRAWLRFHELDLSARIFLNGKCVGTHANAFYPCEVEITGVLRSGENVLAVELESGLYAVAEKPVAGYYRGSEDGRLYKRMWLRKPQFSFGWDWAPRLLNVGIGQSVELIWGDKAKPGSLALRSELSSDGEQGRLLASWEVEGLDAAEVASRLILGMEETGEEASSDVVIRPGSNRLEGEMTISRPERWWPCDLGPQTLYTVTARLEVDGEPLIQRSRRIGFRHVVVEKAVGEDESQGFIFVVNGERVFAKGANWVPADIIPARVDFDRYRTLIERARELNMNFLRVWGGGLYERDAFYELCDAYGILVWQEFAFACAAYPTHDAEFVQDIQAEARHQIRRLAHHPSLIAWCGNNEIEWLTWDQTEGVIRPDHAWFHQTLPRLLKEEDSTRYYQPSSPYSSDTVHPNADRVGDQHPWSVGFENIDFYQYRDMTPSFPNEGGILGPTSLPTLQACLPEGQRHLHSFAWEIHDNSVEDSFSTSAIDRLVQEWVGKDPGRLSLAEYVYWGGLVQGEGLREYIHNFRRRKFATSSAIFWMYNDCWPATRSWTVVDYGLRRTPSFYPVRRAFSPVTVVVAEERGAVRAFGINDRRTPWQGELEFGLVGLDGTVVTSTRQAVAIAANVSAELAALPLAEWEAAGFAETVAYAVLWQGPQVVAQNRMFRFRFREMHWRPAKVQMKRDREMLVFSSSAYAWNVAIDLEGNAVGDNFFDVWPHLPVRIPWPSDRNLPSTVFIGNLLE